MSGLSRYVEILSLFSEARPEWTVQEMSGSLGAPSSTIYRTVRDMLAAGFLEAANEGWYRLGSCFIQLDRLIRMTDPLYRVGTPLLREIVAQARTPCVAVLARLYNDTVMCVADAATPDGLVRTSYERGRPRPLTRGATSKTILAQMPPRKLSRLLEQLGAAERGVQPFDSAVPELRPELTAIRKRGFSVTRGEVDKGLVGIAAPVSVPAIGLVGSLSLVVDGGCLDSQLERRLILLVISTANLLTEGLRSKPASELASKSRAGSTPLPARSRRTVGEP